MYKHKDIFMCYSETTDDKGGFMCLCLCYYLCVWGSLEFQVWLDSEEMWNGFVIYGCYLWSNAIDD